MAIEIVISKYTGTIIEVTDHRNKYEFSGTVIGHDKLNQYRYKSAYKIGDKSDSWSSDSFVPYITKFTKIKII